jgi:hypothetical protein
VPKTKPNIKVETQLAKEVKTLSKEIRKLKNQEFLRVFKNPWRFMWYSFLKGLMVGFGSVMGASVLVGIFFFLVAQISFVPILGDFIEEIIVQVQLDQFTPEQVD